MPFEIGQAFRDLKMGKGFELKGHLSLSDQIRFQGLLSGKGVELFGFQFRTLLGRVDLSPDRIKIYDVKISDSAGSLKIDELLMQNEHPWTISIPHLTIHEMRPSLLLKPGETEAGPISPLVVRELEINGLKGLLDDTKTYKAKGQLHFINSYKREHTVLDLPADVLSRIVGLDLDLLVPVCGTLNYELKEGLFHLLELKDSYSEGERSQFFLSDEIKATVSLKGDLKILITTKQFVLFKLMDAFQVSIEGSLEDPKFHLQKKRRFLGI
jgi:hypothetical protein